MLLFFVVDVNVFLLFCPYWFTFFVVALNPWPFVKSFPNSHAHFFSHTTIILLCTIFSVFLSSICLEMMSLLPSTVHYSTVLRTVPVTLPFGVETASYVFLPGGGFHLVTTGWILAQQFVGIKSNSFTGGSDALQFLWGRFGHSRGHTNNAGKYPRCD